jgi:cobalt-zinc-cadmium efflux system outer membrane protein
MKLLTYLTATIVVCVLLIGCTSIPKDLGRSNVDVLIGERGLPVSTDTSKNKEEFIDALLAEPLTPDSAIRIALTNNPKLKATYADLGIAAADLYEAGRIRNPIFSFSSLDSNESGERNLNTYGLITSFTDLITLPSRKRFAEGGFAVMKKIIGAEIVDTAAETEAAFYEFVAAKQVAALRAQIAKAGELSARLAQRYSDAGNLTPRDYAMEHAIASQTKLAFLEANAEVYTKRTALATLMGLSVAGHWDASAKLPAPLAHEDDIDDLIQLAKQSRLDLAAAHQRADLLADRLGVTNWTRWLGELDVGIEHERETDGADLTGPTLEWEVPIFTQNHDKQLRASAELKIAIAEVERLMIELENGVRLAHAATQNTKERVIEYREKLIPARIEIVERAQEEEAFMLIGIFELLETKQDEYDAYQGYLEIVRDYWLARTELARAVGNTLPSSVRVGGEFLNVEDYLTSKSSGVDHSGHAGMSDQPEGNLDEDAHSHH